ncbi:hypothetical protein RMSM_07410 [Rhodopirellula maiorica SM1]|uniref:Uncharacterized protein n=1 Tax=Rhodopirellula maiorica SM1 TaxID=1265738 RepID=M5RNX7_9BACT|nr:hypothetical protein RMSM_07410 [Rhodopirellula maiorica SM1]
MLIEFSFVHAVIRDGSSWQRRELYFAKKGAESKIRNPKPKTY